MWLVSQFRQPEHVGENRCLPCTVVNVAIALVASVAIGLWAASAGAVAFAVCLAVIYLRGISSPAPRH